MGDEEGCLYKAHRCASDPHVLCRRSAWYVSAASFSAFSRLSRSLSRGRTGISPPPVSLISLCVCVCVCLSLSAPLSLSLSLSLHALFTLTVCLSLSLTHAHTPHTYTHAHTHNTHTTHTHKRTRPTNCHSRERGRPACSLNISIFARTNSNSSAPVGEKRTKSCESLVIFKRSQRSSCVGHVSRRTNLFQRDIWWISPQFVRQLKVGRHNWKLVLHS
jgi:hypothetical protein